MFLYLKTGGGHLAPAKAVAERINLKRKGKVKIQMVDGLEKSGTFVKKIIEDGYKTSINHAAWTYEFLYALHKINIVSRLTAAIISFFIKPSLEKQILDTLPKKIVIFHFFLIKPVFEIISKYNLEIPVLTVVTDPFTAHPIWFFHKNQNYIVFSELLRDSCIDNGIKPDNVNVFPFVIDGKYSRRISELSKLKIRSSLGFGTDSKIVLILGGGEGMPKGKKILKKLISSNMDAEIAIVCGKNKKQYKQAMAIRDKKGLSNLKVFGFVDFVHSLINISDVVITKCGASTFMEILVSGKIPVINNYIWEQEKGNMEYICNSEMGILERKTSFLPEVLTKLLTDSTYYNTLRRNIKNASIRNGVGDVSEYILNFKEQAI
jgi:processive 1,2-diacylglycerol beta-glucosyltransferase/1,2-diacylglycerol 3-beta-galactosyltransferase